MLNIAYFLQRGQALIEAIIAAAFVLVPLFLFMPLLAKYIDIGHNAEQAARYSAWERTVWFQQAPEGSAGAAVKSERVLEQEAAWRFFADGDRTLSTRDDQVDFAISELNAFYTDHKGDALLNDYDDIALQVSEDEAPGKALKPALALLKGLQFSPTTKGLYTANIRVDLTDYKHRQSFSKLDRVHTEDDVLDQLAVTFHRHNVILADGWNADGPEHVKAVVQPLMIPTHTIAPFVNAVGVLPIAREFAEDSLELGKIEPDEVPKQRLD